MFHYRLNLEKYMQMIVVKANKIAVCVENKIS